MRAAKQAAYFTKAAFQNLFRHPMHSVIGVLTLSVSLILVGFLGLFMWKANDLVDAMAGGLRLTVYLEEGASQGAASDLSRVIRSQWPEVKSVTYFSDELDRERNMKLLPQELLVELDPELIPAQPYLEIMLDVERLNEQSVYEMVSWFATLSHVQGVDEVLFGSEKIAVAFSLLAGARNLGVFISVVIVMAAVFFVLTTTRLIVQSRKKEIEVLLLVGATPNFVRLPHYIEGVIQGSVAGSLAFVVVWLLQRQFLSNLRGDVALQVPVDLLPGGMVAWFIAGGVTLGFIGSVLGTARYLRLPR